MKKTGILNDELSYAIANLGHHDQLALGDAGLPVAGTAKRIDLSIVPDLPTVPQVLEALLVEFFPEQIYVAKEQSDISPEVHQQIMSLVGSIPVEEVPHAQLLELAKGVKVHVRTGDFTPYANMVFTAGWVGRPTHKER